jgi:acyl-CoA thioester hydrolase
VRPPEGGAPAGPPGKEQASVFPTYRGSVNSWECDENDHLNVRFFVAKANEGLAFVLHELGCAPTVLERTGSRPRVLRQHMRFLREARRATPIAVLAGISGHRPEVLTVYSEVRHGLTGAVLATLVTDVALVGPDGRGVPIPPPRAELRCEVAEHGRPRGVTGAGPGRPPAHAALAGLGFAEITRGRVAAAECDAHGELEPFQYVGRVSDGVVNLVARFQTEEELGRRSAGIEGGAVVELRIVHHAPLRAGDLFTIQSGLRSVSRRTQHVVHLFFDEESRAGLASCDVIAVAIDLRARTSIEFPEPRRRRMLAGLLRPWEP